MVQALNYEALKWVKQWDQCVFHRAPVKKPQFGDDQVRSSRCA